MRQLLGVLHLLVAIGLMALLGQGILYLMAGQKRAQNLFYQMFQIITSPWVKVFRLITPRFIEDRLVPIAAFAGLSALFIWLAVFIPTVPN